MKEVMNGRGAAQIFKVERKEDSEEVVSAKC